LQAVDVIQKFPQKRLPKELIAKGKICMLLYNTQDHRCCKYHMKSYAFCKYKSWNINYTTWELNLQIIDPEFLWSSYSHIEAASGSLALDHKAKLLLAVTCVS
jgi:hypothetical protein